MFRYLDEAIQANKTILSFTGTAGIAGFVFDIVNETSIDLSCEITDHFLEDGTPIQDHIALYPEKVILSGFQGEIVYTKDGGRDSLQKVAQKLITIGSYLPSISYTVNKLLKQVISGNDLKSISADLFNAGSDLFKLYKNINLPQDRQSEAFIYFEALRNARQTFTIQTPYRYYTDMAIESIKSNQDGTTKDLTSFEVTLKKIRYAQVNTTGANVQGRLVDMISKQINKGITRGQSFGSRITDFFK